MDSRIRLAFLLLVLAQIGHSVEEYVFRFYEVFPPARVIDELVPGFTRPGFLVANGLIAWFGLWCLLSSVRRGTESARDWVWIWVVIELFNGLAHPIWAIASRGYVPGLATAPILFGLAAYLFHRLRATPERARTGSSSERAEWRTEPLGSRRDLDVRIRQAGPEDAELVARTIRSAFRDVADRFELDPENAPTHPSNCQPDWIRSDLDRGVSYFLLCSQGSVVGCVALEFASPTVAYLERLGVVPGQRGRGFGDSLLRHAIGRARSAGARVVSVGVIAEDAELVSWYEHLGFAHVRTRRFSHLPFTVSYLELEIS